MIRRFWNWLGTLGAPPITSIPGPAPLAPLPSDPVNDVNAEGNWEAEAARQLLLDKFVLHHNSYIVRDYGFGPQAVFDKPNRRMKLTDQELNGLANEFTLAGVLIDAEEPDTYGKVTQKTVADMRAERAAITQGRVIAAQLQRDPD